MRAATGLHKHKSLWSLGGEGWDGEEWAMFLWGRSEIRGMPTLPMMEWEVWDGMGWRKKRAETGDFPGTAVVT